MKRTEIKLFYLCILTILASTCISAKEYGTFVYNESSESISEAAYTDGSDSKSFFITTDKTAAAPVIYAGCYELKRVWTWSGWFPKRVWKWVSVSCPRAAPMRRGPGTTIPPH